MNIFESLENLNVSEECFDEIMGIVEDIYDSVLNQAGKEDSPLRNQHGRIYLDDWTKTIRKNREKELESSAKREGVTPEGLEAKRELKKNKDYRQTQKRTDASIARNKEHQLRKSLGNRKVNEIKRFRELHKV